MTKLVRLRPALSRVDELLLEREGRVLVWSLTARLVFLAILTTLTLLQLGGVLPSGIVAHEDSDAMYSLALCLATAAIVALLRRPARRGREIRKIGLGVLLVDLAILIALPFIWLYGTPGFEQFPPGLVKGDLFAVALLMMIINSITLRPLYPAVMAGCSIALVVAVALLTLGGGEAELTNTYVGHFKTPAVNPGLVITRCLTLGLAGAFLTAMASSGRRMIRDTIALELTNLELKERQAELTMEGRLASIKGLVAGLAHELNSPLGVLSSSLGTIDVGVKRLLDSSADGPPQAARARLALEQSTETARHGLERIQGLVESLRDFSRLDDAEAQQADLREELDTVLSLIDSQLIGDVEIIKNYQAIEPIECKPRELNQAFLTILTNAFEALRGRGRLTLGLERRGHELLLTIADTGPGIAASLLPHLFDVSLSHKGERVAMRMGLPAARLIVERHGGRIAVASDLGRGTTFSISLPLKA